MIRRVLGAAMALLILAAGACAEETRFYGGRGEDRLLEMTRAGNGLFAVGTSSSCDGDLSSRTREGFAGWALCAQEDGQRRWSYASAHAGLDRMVSPAALEDGRFALVLTDAQGQRGEWLLLSARGACEVRLEIPEALCAPGRTVLRILLCDQSPAALAVIVSEGDRLRAGMLLEDGSVTLSAPFEGDALGCAASDLRGGVVWAGAREGQLSLTRLQAGEAAQAMGIAFGGFAVMLVEDALLLEDGSVVCCGAAQGEAGFAARVSLEGEVLFVRTFAGVQRCLCPTQTGLAVYGAADGEVTFLDEDGYPQGMVSGLPQDALDLAGTPGGAALLTYRSGQGARQAGIVPVAQPAAMPDPEESLPQAWMPVQTQEAAHGASFPVSGGCLVCAPDGALGVRVTLVDEQGGSVWSTRMPIHTAADTLEWLCAARLSDGRILLGGRTLSGTGEAARQQGVLALLGSDGVLRRMETVPDCGAVCALEVRSVDVLLHIATSAQPGTEPDVRRLWPL
ncbi:MAG: hypothetical protein ACI4PG_12825 [Candidatus Ventricola sp.]